MILKHIFNIDIPLLRIIFAGIIILFGFQLLMGKSAFVGYTDEFNVIFQERTFDQFPKDKKEAEFSTVFGKSVIKLAPETVPSGLESIKINTVFGSTDIYIDPGLNISIEGNSAFAGIILPNGNTTAIGTVKYENQNRTANNTKALKLEINAVFSGVIVRET
jgi:predicted membrane protein